MFARIVTANRKNQLRSVLAAAATMSLAAVSLAAPPGNQPPPQFPGAPPQLPGLVVQQSGGTLTIWGPIENSGDMLRIVGINGTLHVMYSGVYFGGFQNIAHIDVDLWGPKSVAVELKGIQIKGGVAIATGSGSDNVEVVSNSIGGAVGIWTGAGDDGLTLVQNSLQADLNVDTAGDADRIGLSDNDIAANATFDTGPGDDDVSIGIVSPSVEPANKIHGALTIASGDGIDEIRVAGNRIDAGVLLETGSGVGERVVVRMNDVGGTHVESLQSLNVEIDDNRIHGDLTVASGIGGHVEVFANDVDSDMSIATGAANGSVYIYVKDENRIQGNVSMNVGSCEFGLIEVIENAVDRDTSISLGASPELQLDVDKNVLAGTLVIDSAGTIDADLDQNRFKGDVQASASGAADALRLSRNECNGNVTIDMGGGDDLLKVGNPSNPGSQANTFNANITAFGGAGFDTLFHDLLNNYASPFLTQNFESVTP